MKPHAPAGAVTLNPSLHRTRSGGVRALLRSGELYRCASFSVTASE